MITPFSRSISPGVELRVAEHVDDHVERDVAVLGRALDVVPRVLLARERVELAADRVDLAGDVARGRPPLRALEEHVLREVRDPARLARSRSASRPRASRSTTPTAPAASARSAAGGRSGASGARRRACLDPSCRAVELEARSSRRAPSARPRACSGPPGWLDRERRRARSSPGLQLEVAHELPVERGCRPPPVLLDDQRDAERRRRQSVRVEPAACPARRCRRSPAARDRLGERMRARVFASSRGRGPSGSAPAA